MRLLKSVLMCCVFEDMEFIIRMGLRASETVELRIVAVLSPSI